MKLNRLLSLSLAFNIWYLMLYSYGLQSISYLLYGQLWDIRIGYQILQILTFTNILTYINLCSILIIGMIIDKLILTRM